MKADIHPKLHPVVFIDSSTGAEFITMTTIKTEETKKIKGVEHYIVRVDISSASHPFYTGKKTMVDTAGRVDKFRARMEAAKKRQEEEAARSKKKDDAKKETPEEAISRKAKVNTEKKEEEKAKKKAAAKKTVGQDKSK
jgi:large subunit ribosomal protein L31